MSVFFLVFRPLLSGSGFFFLDKIFFCAKVPPRSSDKCMSPFTCGGPSGPPISKEKTMAVKDKVSDIVKTARKIAEESNRPMSPDEIKNKYALEFPFTVKRVIKTTGGTLGVCPHIATGEIGEIITFYRYANTGGYVYGEPCSCHNWGDPSDGFNIDHDSKRFVLV